MMTMMMIINGDGDQWMAYIDGHITAVKINQAAKTPQTKLECRWEVFAQMANTVQELQQGHLRAVEVCGILNCHSYLYRLGSFALALVIRSAMPLCMMP